jgi:hypothetical protein
MAACAWVTSFSPHCLVAHSVLGCFLRVSVVFRRRSPVAPSRLILFLFHVCSMYSGVGVPWSIPAHLFPLPVHTDPNSDNCKEVNSILYLHVNSINGAHPSVDSDVLQGYCHQIVTCMLIGYTIGLHIVDGKI